MKGDSLALVRKRSLAVPGLDHHDSQQAAASRDPARSSLNPSVLIASSPATGKRRPGSYFECRLGDPSRETESGSRRCQPNETDAESAEPKEDPGLLNCHPSSETQRV